jgi:type VI secretion system secreted protein VgrG
MKIPIFADQDFELTARSRSLQERYESRQRPATPFEFLSGAWCAGELLVRRMRGTEAISTCFRFEVEFQSEVDPAVLRPGLFGRAATLLLHAPGRVPRPIHGAVTALRLVGALAGAAAGTLVWRARLEPHLAFLRHRVNSRIHQDLSNIDVVLGILDRYRIAHRAALTARYRPLPYCVQYEESDLAFLERQLALAGIAYWFEPPPGLVALCELERELDPVLYAQACAQGEVLVLADAAQAYSEFQRSNAQATPGLATLNLCDGDIDRARDDDAVLSLTADRRMRPMATLLYEYDFARPQAVLTSQAALPTAPDAASPSALLPRLLPLLGDLPPPFDPHYLEHYEHHGEFEDTEVNSAATAARTLEALRADASTAVGRSLCRRVAAGARFTLEQHAVAALNRAYAVVRVEHRGFVPALLPREAERRGVYENRFRCVPAEVIHRPKRPRRKLQQVTEVAKVVGPPGEDIHTDAHGRVKVQFPWDRHGASDEHSSCWIRATQSWAGSSWGTQLIPRVGMEVLVSFIGGDIDRPVIVGALYNGSNATPFGLPAGRTRSGWRSNSSPGGGGFNEFSFEDLAGREQVLLSAQRDYDVSVGHDHRREVRHDEHVVVHHQQHTEVHGERRTEVRGADHLTVARGRTEDITLLHARTVDGDSQETVRGMQNRTVSGISMSRFESMAVVNAEAEVVATVASDVVLGVGKHDAPKTLLLHAEGEARVEGTRRVELSSDTEVVLRCGTSMIRLRPDGVEISAGAVSISGGGASLGLGGGNARIRAKGSLEGVAARVVLRSAGASLGLTADASLDGAEVLLKSPVSAEGGGIVLDEIDTQVEVTDDQGNPMAGEPFQVNLGDGSTRAGFLDERGRAELPLDGHGTIVFPRLTGVERS